jgi:hypothetical protein
MKHLETVNKKLESILISREIDKNLYFIGPQWDCELKSHFEYLLVLRKWNLSYKFYFLSHDDYPPELCEIFQSLFQKADNAEMTFNEFLYDTNMTKEKACVFYDACVKAQENLRTLLGVDINTVRELVEDL